MRSKLVLLCSRRVLAASFVSTLCRGLITVGFVLSVARCVPEFEFAADCAEGMADCDGLATGPLRCETNLRTSTKNCGKCGKVCDLPEAEAACVDGQCVPTECTPGYADCDGLRENGCEASLQSAVDHCGACDQRCNNINGTPKCSAGTCSIQCVGLWRDCNGLVSDGCEAILAEDVKNCGGCGKVCAPDAGKTPFCKDGTCGATACKAGFGDCDGDGVCTQDLATDKNNCGYCGHRCLVQNGTAECVDGKCQVQSCLDGYANCDDSAEDKGYATGCEVRTDSSLENCGACGNHCSVGQGVPRCVEGKCRVGMCNTGFADCDGDGQSCETDTRSDPLHCGGCAKQGGTKCNDLFRENNATGSCVNGSCVFEGCLPGYDDCDSDQVCETNLKTDRNNCGQCDIVCKTGRGTPSNRCEDAMCRPECAANYGDCNDSRSDGCEANFLSDVEHCGGCEPCSKDGTRRVSCEMGKCVPVCADGFKDCDGDPSNGCEKEIATDPDHCGECKSVCELSGGTEENVCKEGKCVPLCKLGSGDCDGNPKNGCESSVVDDDANCGGCDVACRSGEGTHATSNHCEGTKCVPACEPGFAACSSPELGCVTPLNTAEHCGSCLTSCGDTTPSCVESHCQSRISVLQQARSFVERGTLNLGLSLLNTGPNRLLLLAVSGRSVKPNSLEQGKPEEVKLAGKTFIPVRDELDGGMGPSKSAGQGHLFFYYLLEDDLRSVGADTNIQIIAEKPQAAVALAAEATLFSGVDQTNPFAGTTHGIVEDADCKDKPPRDTLTLTRGGSVIYSLVTAQNIGEPQFSAVQPLMKTMLFSSPDDAPSYRVFAVQGGYAGVDSVLPSGPQPIGWNFTSCSNWTMLSVVIQPVQR